MTIGFLLHFALQNNYRISLGLQNKRSSWWFCGTLQNKTLGLKNTKWFIINDIYKGKIYFLLSMIDYQMKKEPQNLR